MIRLLLAEDQGMMRGALAQLLALEPDMEVVAEVARGDEVVEHVHKSQPDVALLDIEMPGMSGLDVCEALAKMQISCKCIIVTTFGKPGYLRRAIEASAAGFLVKDAPVSNLAIAIRRVIAGERVIDPELAIATLSEGACPLTNRELDVLREAQNGASAAQIAAQLCLSEGTVRNHISLAIQKLRVKNREQAVHAVREKGWI